MRPVLSPASTRLWRDEQTLQLGRADGRAVVVAGLSSAQRALLGLLDGTRDLATLQAQAGVEPAAVEGLLAQLRNAGLVVDGDLRWPAHLPVGERDRLTADALSLGLLHGDGLPVLARRGAASVVVVVGAGRVGAPLAVLLASAGVGAVDVVDDAATRPCDLAPGGLTTADLGAGRGRAARALVRAAVPTVAAGPVARPDLVVLAPVGAAADTRALTRDGRPHLLAEVRETVGVVGPLVLPGTSACLHCLDLERTDRDPDWPVLAAQLQEPVRGAVACDGVLASAVVAQAALQALALLDGGPAPAAVGGTLELALPDWRWRRRTWRPHSDCDCRWLAAG